MAILRRPPASLVCAIDLGAAGAGAADPWALLDGRSGAPAGTPQYPTLLNTYHDAGVPDGRYRWPSLQSKIPVNTGNIVQPPWMVPGVDYHVGIDRTLFPTNASLQSAAAVSLVGTNLDTTNHLVNVTGNNVVLNGVDFSVSPGWSCSVTGNNVTISNCNFLASGTQSSCPIQGGGTGLTVVNCEIDGNFEPDTVMSGTNPTLLQLTGAGLIIKYSLLQRSWGDFIDLESGGSTTLHYNVFKDLGNINSHPDVFQIASGTYGPDSMQFNLLYWTAAGTYGPQGFFWTQPASSPVIHNVEVGYITTISQATSGPAAMAPIVAVNMNGMPGGFTARIHDMFCDPTGVQSNWALVDPNPDSNGSTWNYPQGKVWNNTNMLNGVIDSAGPPNFTGTGP